MICSTFRTFRSARRYLVLRGSVSGSGKRRRGYPCTSPGLDAPKGRAFPSLTAARDRQPSPAGGRRSASMRTDPPKRFFSLDRARPVSLLARPKEKWGVHWDKPAIRLDSPAVGNRLISIFPPRNRPQLPERRPASAGRCRRPWRCRACRRPCRRTRRRRSLPDRRP